MKKVEKLPVIPAFDEVSKSSNTVLKMITQIAVESENQAIEAEEIATNVENISNIVQSNASISQETAATIEELTAQSEVIVELIHQFKVRGTCK